MQLRVTRRTDLASRALVSLSNGGGRRKASDLADELDASAGFLTQALTPVVAKGWIRSDPGPTGGYTSVVPLDAITVLELVEAVEGCTDVTTCVLQDRPCAGGGRCALHDAWARARTSLLSELSATPLSAVADRPGLAIGR